MNLTGLPPSMDAELVQRLATVLLHFLWQGAAVGLLHAGLMTAMRGASAHARYLASCVALAAMALCPVLTFIKLGPDRATTASISPSAQAQPVHPRTSSPITVQVTVAERPVTSPAHEFQRTAPPVLAPAWQWQHAVVGAWLAGMLALSLWHGAGWLGLQRLRRRPVEMLTGEFKSMMCRLARRMGISRRTQVFWSRNVRGPVAFGFWKPIVLLPLSLASGLSVSQVEMLLAHEFAHLKRHDYLVNLLQAALESALFFHPAVWLLSHAVRREREHACDDLAVAAMGSAPDYARLLIRLAELENEAAPLPRLSLAAGSRQGALRQRVTRLLPRASAPPLLRPTVGAGVLTLLWFTLSGAAVPLPLAASTPATEGLRGAIRDRNGVVLAVSDKPDRQMLFDIAKVLAAYKKATGKEPPVLASHRIRPDGTGEDFVGPDVHAVFSEWLLPQLRTEGLAKPYGRETLQRYYRDHDDKTLFVFAGGLSEAELQKAAAAQDRLPGLSTRTVLRRRYPWKALACHVLGYVSQTKEGSVADEEGRWGVEKTCDSLLAPPQGAASSPAKRGSDVHLTLDARHQYVVEKALRESQPAVTRGAVVLLDVHTGDILAMASAPSYDPNDFVPALNAKQFEKYKSPVGNLLNRAVRGFTPGAAFKIVTSLAAICDGKEGVTSECTGSATYGSRRMLCWIGQKTDGKGGHGALSLRQALAADCGPYFYDLGNQIRPDKFSSMASLLGLNRKTGVELPDEFEGIFPDEKWWKQARPKESYGPATIANLSIGQGAVTLTPLQMAAVTATIANGGTVWRPRLIHGTGSRDNPGHLEKPPAQRAADLREHGLTESGLTTLQGGMRDIVTGGPAKRASLPGLGIAGKAGTVQNWRNDNGAMVRDNQVMFVAYAPAEKPRWAIVVLVQGAMSGGETAVPLAAHILQQVEGIESGTLKVRPEPLDPIEGSFEIIRSLNFPMIAE